MCLRTTRWHLATSEGESRRIKRQIYHTPGLAHCHCLRRNSRSGPRNVMIKLSAAALAYARQSGFSALVFNDAKTPTGQSAAYTKAAADDLSQMGLVALNQHLFFGKPTGRRSERTTAAVVAQVNDGAGRWPLASVGCEWSAAWWLCYTGSRQLRRHHAERRQRKGQGPAPPVRRWRVWRVRFCRLGHLLLNEPQCSERLSLTQQLMINPVVRSAATELIAAQDEAIACYEAEGASGMLEPVQRSAASKKAVHQRNIRVALSTVPLRRPGSIFWWPPSHCRAPRAWAPSTPRCSSSRVMIATAIRRVSRRLPLPSPARHAKCRSTLTRT